MSDSSSSRPPPVPRWVKTLAMVAAVIVIIIVIALVSGGEHGPGRHRSGLDSANHTPPLEHAL
jgi:hypothetical protein